MNLDARKRREQFLKRKASLANERSSWVEHWRELSEQFSPRRSRFLSTSAEGRKKHTNIINGVGLFSRRVLASGMMAGITSPARAWYRLTLRNSKLNEVESVRYWLQDVEDIIRETFAKSNIYNALHAIYEDLAVYGTAACVIDEDAQDGIRAYVVPIGSYCLANGAQLKVDTFYRELSLSVGQCAERFGVDALSARAKASHRSGDVDGLIQLVHAIEPNPDHVPGRIGSFPFRSCWVETGSDDGIFIERGYEEFPVLAPRWSTSGEDVYGYSPGMDALGDARALQLLEKRKAQIVDKIVAPPMRGPSSLTNQRASLLPGDITYIDAVAPGQTFAPAMEISPVAVQVVDASIREHEQRIKSAFFADLWLMLSEGVGRMTAREVSERHEEKMLQLGPVLEKLSDDLLEPLISRTFGVLARRGDIPPPPDELVGEEIKVEYLSLMAVAQKQIGISSIERLASFAGNLAAVRPEVLDKLDVDQFVDEYSQALSSKPGLVRSDEAVEEIRQARAQAARARQMAEQVASSAQAARVLSQADMSGDTALNRLMSSLGGPASAYARG